jgi:hypothetical protein
MAVALSCVGLAAVAAAQEHLQRRAESFALSGADALSGRIGGYACQLVREMAAKQSLGLDNCTASGLEIRVELTQRLGDLTLSARAHAGPPVSAANLTSR